MPARFARRSGHSARSRARVSAPGVASRAVDGPVTAALDDEECSSSPASSLLLCASGSGRSTLPTPLSLLRAARRLDLARVRAREIGLVGRYRRRLMRVRRTPEAGTLLHPPAGVVGLIGRVGLALDPVLLIQAPLGVLEAFGARAGNRALLLGARSSSRRLASRSHPRRPWAVENSDGNSSPRQLAGALVV